MLRGLEHILIHCELLDYLGKLVDLHLDVHYIFLRYGNLIPVVGKKKHQRLSELDGGEVQVYLLLHPKQLLDHQSVSRGVSVEKPQKGKGLVLVILKTHANHMEELILVLLERFLRDQNVLSVPNQQTTLSVQIQLLVFNFLLDIQSLLLECKSGLRVIAVIGTQVQHDQGIETLASEEKLDIGRGLLVEGDLDDIYAIVVELLLENSLGVEGGIEQLVLFSLQRKGVFVEQLETFLSQALDLEEGKSFQEKNKSDRRAHYF